jgi:hypothetical protein
VSYTERQRFKPDVRYATRSFVEAPTPGYDETETSSLAETLEVGYNVADTSSLAETLVDFDISYVAAPKKDDGGSHHEIGSEPSNEIRVTLSPKSLYENSSKPGITGTDAVVSWLEGLTRVGEVNEGTDEIMSAIWVQLKHSPFNLTALRTLRALCQKKYPLKFDRVHIIYFGWLCLLAYVSQDCTEQGRGATKWWPVASDDMVMMVLPYAKTIEWQCV